MYAHFFWSSLVKKALKVCFCDFLVLARTAGVSERLFDWLWCCLVQGHRAFSLFLYLPSQECSLHASSVLCIIPKALTSRFWLWCFNLVFNFTLASFARKARTQEYGNFCYGFSLLQSTVFLPVLSKRWQPRATAFFLCTYCVPMTYLPPQLKTFCIIRESSVCIAFVICWWCIFSIFSQCTLYLNGRAAWLPSAVSRLLAAVILIDAPFSGVLFWMVGMSLLLLNFKTAGAPFSGYTWYIFPVVIYIYIIYIANLRNKASLR